MIAPGTFGSRYLKPRMIPIVAAPYATVGHDTSPSEVIHAHCCWNQLPEPFGNAEQIGDLARGDLDADAREEADEDGCRQEVADEPEAQHPRDDQQHAAHERRQPAQRHPLRRSRLQAGDRRRR